MPTIIAATDGSPSARAAVDCAVAEAIAAEAGIAAETCLVSGDAAAEICRRADEQGASLIVMGTRGRKPLAAAILGSVAARVLQHAACPVMVVPDSEPRT